jgi:hypothetical protein
VRTRLTLSGSGIVLSAVVLAWLSGSLHPGRAQAPQDREISPVERIRRMKAGDPNVPARIEQAMDELQAKARQLRRSLEDVQQQWQRLDEMKRAHIAPRQQSAGEARTISDKLDEILRRLGRIERRLDLLEGKGANSAPDNKEPAGGL